MDTKHDQYCRNDTGRERWLTNRNLNFQLVKHQPNAVPHETLPHVDHV